jgi:hypothetical protein
MPQLEASLHDRPTEVVDPVSETHGLIHVDVVFDRKGRCCGRVENSDLPSQHFNLTGGQLRVRRFGASGLDTAAHGEDVLGANLLCPLVRLGRRVGLEHDLGQSGSIAKVDEDHAAVVSTAVHPAEQHYVLADVVCSKVPTPVCTSQVSEKI